MMCDDIVRGVGANSATGLRGSNAQKRANANLVKPFCLCRSGQADSWGRLRSPLGGLRGAVGVSLDPFGGPRSTKNAINPSRDN